MRQRLFSLVGLACALLVCAGAVPQVVNCSVTGSTATTVNFGCVLTQSAPPVVVPPPPPPPPPPPATGAIKFHPGHYIELDPGSGGGGLAGWLKVIASLKGAPGVVGVTLIQHWGALEFAPGVYSSGSGTTARGIAMVDQLIAAAQAAGLQFILGYEDRSFGAPHTFTAPSSFGQLPSYFDTLEGGKPGYIDAPSGTTLSGSLQVAADVVNPLVTARAIALVAAYCARYDANPTFEMLRTSETANGSLRNSSAYDAYVVQLQGWMAGARAACPHTGLSISSNFMTNAAQFSALFATGATYAIAFGGPDVKLNLPGTPPYLGTDSIVFNGYTGGKDWRGILARVAEAQYGDVSAQAPFAPLYAEMMTGTLATGGSVKPQYFIWSAAAPAPAFNLTAALAYVKSINGAINTARPTSYH